MIKRTRYFQNCLGVFQGGGCKASAYVGAYKEAKNWGVSFSELVGTSAGAIVAVLIAAGANPNQLEEIIEDLDFKKFLSKPLIIEGYTPPNASKYLKFLPFKISKKYLPIITHLGLYNSIELKKWLNKKLSEIIPNKNQPIKFKDLVIPVHVIVSDIVAKKIEIFSNDESPNMDVAEAVQYSCNIPLFFQPIELRYLDGGMLSNLPSFIFNDNLNKFYNKILAFSLESNSERKEISNIQDYAEALLETIIDGNLELQISLQENLHIIKINTGDIKATDFEKINKTQIDFLKDNGKKAVSDFFSNEVANLRGNQKRHDILIDSFQTNNKITQLLERKYDEILIIDDDNKWVYEIFPTLLKWFYDKSKIVFVCKYPVKDDAHYKFRNRFLENSGVKIVMVNEISFKGFVFDGESQEYCRAIILGGNDHFHSKYYEGETDFHLINLVRKQYSAELDGIAKPKIKFSIEKVEDEFLIKQIRNVKQYNRPKVKISIKQLNVNEIIFVTKYVRGYKYRQIETLFDVFKNSGIEYFEPSKLILDHDKFTLITPPVVEMIGDKYYLIEGNTRLVFAFNNEINVVKCIVVEGVDEQLPTDGRFNIKEVILSDKEVIGEERYNNFNYAVFRKIESSVRNPDNCLI